MKRIWTIFLLGGALWGADVTIYQKRLEVVDNAVRLSATDRARKIFAAIGIELEWRVDQRGPSANPSIVVEYTMRTPGHPGAVAFARPFDPDRVITVMYDRILAETTANRSVRSAVLAHVLAHEIGHVLMRTDAHSAEGVMKAHWGIDDYSRMIFRPLSFLPEDAVVIRRALGREAAEASTRATAESDGADRGRSGSSRDWAAKGVMLLGAPAAIPESFERTHRDAPGRDGGSAAAVPVPADGGKSVADGNGDVPDPGRYGGGGRRVLEGGRPGGGHAESREGVPGGCPGGCGAEKWDVLRHLRVRGTADRSSGRP